MAARRSILSFTRCCSNQIPLAGRIPLRASILPCNVSPSLTSRPFSVSIPAQAKKYSRDHEWIEVKDGKGTIGISTYAANALGDVVFVELPTVDTSFSAGDTIGAVESVKSASDIMTPVAGKVVEVNEVLNDAAGTINKDPEGEGWIAVIEVEDEAELGELMDVEAYKEFTDE